MNFAVNLTQNNFTNSPSLNGPRLCFEGIMHTDKYLTGGQLVWRLKRDPDKFVGKSLPSQVSYYGLPEPKMVDVLNRLSALLAGFLALPGLKITATINGKPMDVHFIGEGKAGRAFLIRNGDNEDVVLKVFRPWLANYLHPRQAGAAGEMANGLLLSNYDINNCAKFYCGYYPNWLLIEFIDEHMKPDERKGEPLEVIAQRLGLTIVDSKPKNLNPFGIRYELGSIYQKGLKHRVIGDLANDDNNRKYFETGTKVWDLLQNHYQSIRSFKKAKGKDLEMMIRMQLPELENLTVHYIDDLKQTP